MRLACPLERLDCLPIPEVKLNLECRHEIIPIVRGLQHLYGNVPLRQEALRLAQLGRTALYVAVDGALAGLVAVADPVRPTSAAAVQRLQRLGLEVVLLSGDSRQTAEAVARSVGIDRVVAEVLPEGKVAEVKRLQEQGRVVAMGGRMTWSRYCRLKAGRVSKRATSALTARI